MPSVSRNQQIVAAIAKHHPEQLYERNKGMAKMSPKQLDEFASTPRKGLPKKVQHYERNKE
jgi:hypothetical protein